MSNRYAAPVEMGGYAITGLGGTFGSTTALNGALADARYLQLAGGTLTGAVLFPLGTAALPSVSFAGDPDTGVWSPGANILAVSSGGTERLRFNGGNADFSGSARVLGSFGVQVITDSSARMSFLSSGNRGWRWITSSTGSTHGNMILQGTTDGFATLTDAIIVTPAGNITPGVDNTQNLGSGSLRMATIFAGTGTINTSDAREKNNILPITDELLDKWAGVEAVSFKFKGRNRTHFGYTAQQVLECMGEDAFKYALLCRDEITKPVKRTVTKKVQKTEAKTVNEEAVEIIDGVPTIVVKTRETQEPVFEMVQVIDADGKPVMTEREIEVDGEPDDEGNPTKTTQIITEPRLHPVPVMVESEVEETVDEPAGDRLGLRYDQCAVIEAAWTRRELTRALARIAALEAA